MQPVTHVTLREPTLVSSTHYCVMGDVAIDKTAAIAPGVVLQAAPGSRIVVGQGACLAAGVCVQSRAGVLTISAGVSLGASVLVIGKGTIGVNACVSPGSTLIDPSVAAKTILPPGMLIGDQKAGSPSPAQSYSSDFSQSQKGSRVGSQANGYSSGPSTYQSSGPSNGYRSPQTSTQPSSQPDTFKNTFVEPGPIEAKPISIPDLSDQSSEFVPPPLLNQPFNSASASPPNQSQNGTSVNGVQSGYGSSSLTVHPTNNQVYGKSQVTELISTLFPNRQPLNDNSSS